MTKENRPQLPIYLDYQATTPVDARVAAAMQPYASEIFGNAHSVQHAHGHRAEEAVEKARAQVADLIGASPREIVFTSGATESNNLAVKGVARFHLKHHGKAHIVSCATEHKCVLESCRDMEAEGARVTWLPVRPNGLIEPDALAAAITDDTVLVSIMAANNEIGVLQPIADIGDLCRERGVWFHTDAAQAAGKIPLDVDAMNIDLLSISGHKLYGPKGVGALYVRRRPRVRLEPLFSGGGQERGLRSGTLPVPLCVGLGEACSVARQEMAEEAARLKVLRDGMLTGLRVRIPDAILNGDADRRLPGNLNLSFPGVDGTELLDNLPDLSVSSGSACTSAELEPSYVLRALGLDDHLAHASLRIGFGRMTSDSEVDFAVEYLANVVSRLREEPAMVKAGA